MNRRNMILLPLTLAFATVAATTLTQAAEPVNAPTVAAPAPFQVKVIGHGQPIILIPGLSSSGDTYDQTVAHYRDRYQLHVLTLAGFAGAPPVQQRPNGASFLDYERDQIAAYIRAQKLDHPVIIGHSLGGTLALSIAAKYPDLPGRLIIVDSYPFLAAVMMPNATVERARALGQQMQAGMKKMTQEEYEKSVRSGQYTRAMVTSDKDFERIKSWGLVTDPNTVADAYADLIGMDLRDDIARIKAPTMVMGTWLGYAPYADHAGIQTMLQQQYSKLPNADLRVSDTARHFIMYDDPTWFLAQLDSVLTPAAAAKVN